MIRIIALRLYMYIYTYMYTYYLSQLEHLGHHCLVRAELCEAGAGTKLGRA